MKTKPETTIQPIGKRILVKDAGSAGRFKTNDSISLPNKVVVLAIGDKVESIKVGDVLLVRGYAVEAEEVDGVRHLFTYEDDMLLLGKVCKNSSRA